MRFPPGRRKISLSTRRRRVKTATSRRISRFRARGIHCSALGRFSVTTDRGQFMKQIVFLVLAVLLSPTYGIAKESKPLPAADDRFKADILLVVAHPDDEGGAT